MDFLTSREDFLKRLESESDVLRTDEIRDAFKNIDRADFIEDDYKVEAYEDYSLPIGFGQTTVKPTIVAFMIELLGVVPGDRVLNVGSGSGWTTALLGEIVGPEGFVLGLEIVPELVEQGKRNIAKYKLPHIQIRQVPTQGAPEGPDAQGFDRILVNAALEDVSADILDQLGPSGVMVMPIKDSLWRFEKNSDGEVVTREYPGFSFDPLL